MKPLQFSLFALALLTTLTTLTTLAATAAVAAQPHQPLPTDAAHARARAAFTTLKTRAPKADVVWNPGQPGAHVIVGLMQTPAGTDDLTRAQAFLATHADLIGIGPNALKHITTSRSKHRIAVRFQQHHRGIEVLDRLVVVRLDHDGRALGFVSDAMPIGKLAARRISADQARSIALAASSRATSPLTPPPVRPAIIALPGRSSPVWVVDVIAKPLREHLRVVVNASTGRIVGSTNHIKH